MSREPQSLDQLKQLRAEFFFFSVRNFPRNGNQKFAAGRAKAPPQALEDDFITINIYLGKSRGICHPRLTEVGQGFWPFFFLVHRIPLIPLRSQISQHLFFSCNLKCKPILSTGGRWYKRHASLQLLGLNTLSCRRTFVFYDLNPGEQGN